MLRSGFILGVSAPAALLTVLVHPILRDAADQWSPPVALTAPASVTIAPAPLPGMRPANIALSPTRVAGVPRIESRSVPVATQTLDLNEKATLKPRRALREGCEAPLSALVGPEARRMMPGRCIS